MEWAWCNSMAGLPKSSCIIYVMSRVHELHGNTYIFQPFCTDGMIQASRVLMHHVKSIIIQ